MTAPTEPEIREMLEERERAFSADTVARPVREAVSTAFQVITYTDLDPQDRDAFAADYLSDTWADLNPSQQADLAVIVERAEERAREAAHEAIRREVVAAALEFGARHPDADRVPRGEVARD